MKGEVKKWILTMKSFLLPSADAEAKLFVGVTLVVKKGHVLVTTYEI
jgi:hypothetical protein